MKGRLRAALHRALVVGLGWRAVCCCSFSPSWPSPLRGCGGSSSDASGPVRFLVFGDPEEISAYRKLVHAYGEAQPEAEVELIEASDRTDLIARLSTSIAGGSPPDLFLINYRFYGQFASKGRSSR